MAEFNPLDALKKRNADPEQKTKKKRKEREQLELRTVRTYKHLVKEIQRLLLDFEEYKNITDFVSQAIEEKLEKERKKHK